MAALERCSESDEGVLPPPRVGSFVSFVPSLDLPEGEVDVPREADLTDIEVGIRNGCHRYAVHGPSGVGKTRLAHQFARRWGAKAAHHVYWFPAADGSTLQWAYSWFADSCWRLHGTPNSVRIHASSVDEVCSMVNPLLRQTSNVLLVFDGVEDVSMIEEIIGALLPLSDPTSNTAMPDVFALITTHSLALFDDSSSPAAARWPCRKELGGFTQLEAAEYFHGTLKKRFPADVPRLLQSSAIIEACTHRNPSLLRWVSALVCRGVGNSVDGLLEKLQESSSVFALVVDALAADDRANNVHGCEMLCHAARLASCPIPMEVLRLSMGITEEAAEAAAQSLVSLSLATLMSRGAPAVPGVCTIKAMPSLQLHGLVKDERNATLIMKQHRPTTCTSAAFLKSLNALFPLVVTSRSVECVQSRLPYIPHVKHVLDTLEDEVCSCGCSTGCTLDSDEAKTNAMQLMGKVSRCIMDNTCGEMSMMMMWDDMATNRLRSWAHKYALKGLEIYRKRLPEDHPDLSLILHTVASCHYNLRCYEKALALGLEAIEIQRKVERPAAQNETLALCLSFAYICFGALGKDEQALEYGLEALDKVRELFPDGHSETVVTLTNVATFYGHFGKSEEELNLLLESITTHRKVLELTHSDFATSLVCVSSYYSKDEDYHQALSYALEAFAIQRQALPEAYLGTIVTVGLIANCYANLKNFLKVIAYTKEGLRLMLIVLKGKSAVYAHARSLSVLGQCYAALHDSNVALGYALDALGMMQTLSFKSIELDQVECLHVIVECYLGLGDRQRALTYVVRLLEMLQSVLNRSVETEDERESLPMDVIQLCVQTHTYVQPVDILRSVLDNLAADKHALWKTHPESHAIVMQSFATLMRCVAGINGADLSLKYAMDLLDLRRSLLEPKTHPDIVQSLCDVAICYTTLGDCSSALTYALEGLEIQRKELPASQLAVSLLHTVGTAYADLSNFKLGLTYALEAVAVAQRENCAPPPQEALEILKNISRCYAQLGNHKQALKYALEALEAQRKMHSGPHADVVEALTNASVCLLRVKDEDQSEAISNLFDALAMQREVNPEGHRLTLEILYNISLGYLYDGQHKQALKYALEALEIRRQLPESTLELIIPLQIASMCFVVLGDQDLALKYAVEALALKPEVLREGASHLAGNLVDLGQTFSNHGFHELACKYKVEELKIMREVRSDTDSDTIDALKQTALCFVMIGDYAQAIHHNLEAVEALRKSAHPDAPKKVASTLETIATYYVAMGNRSLALRNALEALELQRTVLPESHPRIASALTTIGLCYVAAA